MIEFFTIAMVSITITYGIEAKHGFELKRKGLLPIRKDEFGKTPRLSLFISAGSAIVAIGLICTLTL